jgi:hypothetical protein
LLEHLGFKKPENDEDEDTLEKLDAFISTIATIFNSLLEGSDNGATIIKMATILEFDDLKNRMLTVFGQFLLGIDSLSHEAGYNSNLFPVDYLEKG